jgi:hypothetical protein
MSKINDTEIRLVSELAEMQVLLEEEIAVAEELLKKKKHALNTLRQETLPNAMTEVGMSSFTLSNGSKIAIKTNYYASIPKDKEADAHHWLKEHGFEALIKNQVIAEFGKGEDSVANEWVDYMRDKGVFPQHKMSIHPQTLKAFVKEQLTAGVDIPMELFGAFVLNESVVTLP